MKIKDESELKVEQEEFKRAWFKDDLEAESIEFRNWLIEFTARGDTMRTYMKEEEKNQRW